MDPKSNDWGPYKNRDTQTHWEGKRPGEDRGRDWGNVGTGQTNETDVLFCETNRLIDIENRFVVAKGWGEGRREGLGVWD